MLPVISVVLHPGAQSRAAAAAVNVRPNASFAAFTECGNCECMMPYALVLLGAVLAQVPAYGRAPAAHPRWEEFIGGFGPRAVRQLLPPASKRVLAHETAETWAASGWNAFRWGMGPADVADRLRDSGGDFRVSAAEVWDECLEVRDNPFDTRCFVYDDHAFMLLGSAPTVEFGFIDDRLSSIRLFLHPRGKRFYSSEIGDKLFTQLLGLLRNEYGPASLEYTPPITKKDGRTSAMRAAQWTSEPRHALKCLPPVRCHNRRGPPGFEIWTWVSLDTSPDLPEGRGDIVLTYMEERWNDHIIQRLQGVADSHWPKSRGACRAVHSGQKTHGRAADSDVKKLRGVCLSFHSNRKGSERQ
jgi:hypothetical protein